MKKYTFAMNLTLNHQKKIMINYYENVKVLFFRSPKTFY